MLNQVSLIGHLGKDPEIRRTGSGDKVATFRIATSESWKDKTSGERKERTQWHTIVIFNDALAGIAERYLRKGSKAFVQGQLENRKWTDRDNVERWSTEVVLRQFNGTLTLLDKAERQAPDPDGYGDTRTREPSRESAGGSGGAGAGGRGNYDLDDDIPF